MIPEVSYAKLEAEVGDLKESSSRLTADVGVMEFVGNHFSTTLHVPGTHLNLSADLSMNAVRDLGIRSGGSIEIAIPPGRLRMFRERRAEQARVACPTLPSPGRWGRRVR